MLTGTSIQNFRGIGGSLDLSWRRLNILLGVNGSGKSSVLQAIMLTAQSALESPDQMDLIANGSRIQLLGEGQSVKDLYFNNDDTQPLAVRLDFRVIDTSSEPRLAGREIGYKWSRRGKDQNAWRSWTHQYLRDGDNIWRTWSERGPANSYFLYQQYRDAPPTPFHTRIDRVANGNQLNMHLRNSLGNEPDHVRNMRDADIELVLAMQAELEQQYEKLTYLSDLRGEKLIQSETGPQPEGVGAHGQELRRLLTDIRARSQPGFRLLREYAAQFGLDALDSGTSGPQRVQVVFRDKASGARLEIQQAAAGAVNALTILAQLFLGEQSQTLLIEEPETHLHAEYILHVADAMAAGVASGHQIIATTHSGIFLSAIGHLVRAGKLDADDIQVWHLDRSASGVKATSLEFAQEGFLKEDVPSFLNVEREMLDAWQQKTGFDQVLTAREGNPPDDRRPRVERRPRGKLPSKPRRRRK